MEKPLCSILSLPPELLTSILEHLPIETLPHLEFVCRHFLAITEKYFRKCYGSGPTHRTANKPSCWRTLFLEQQKIRKASCSAVISPEDAIQVLLHSLHLPDEHIANVVATDIIVRLDTAVLPTTTQNEALAMTYMAQRRYEEARELYSSLLATVGSLPECSHIVKARFGWPWTWIFPASLSQGTRQTAAKNAIRAQDLSTLKELWDPTLDQSRLVTSVAQYGTREIMEFLANSDVNVGNSNGCITPLQCAAFSGQLEIVRYLLELGVDPEPQECCSFGNTAIELARLSGHLDVVKLLATWCQNSHRPYNGTKTSVLSRS